MADLRLKEESLSNLVPEGASAPVPESVDEPAQGSGLRAAHVAGGGVVVVAGAVVVAVCNHFGWTVSDSDSLIIGGAAVSIGAGLGHVIGESGVVGALRMLWRGRSA